MRLELESESEALATGIGIRIGITGPGIIYNSGTKLGVQQPSRAIMTTARENVCERYSDKLKFIIR